MDDVITVAAAINDSYCTYTDALFVDVETQGELTRGQTIAFGGKQINQYAMRDHKNCRIANSIKGKEFMNSFVSVLSGH